MEARLSRSVRTEAYAGHKRCLPRLMDIIGIAPTQEEDMAAENTEEKVRHMQNVCGEHLLLASGLLGNGGVLARGVDNWKHG